MIWSAWLARVVHRIDQTAFEQAVVTVGTLYASERVNVIPVPTHVEAGMEITVKGMTRRTR
ncbi:hypothetical protein [Nonomuraea sp. NPDC005650]|uniref:hypothetical protein n=1 Tax=Nonomuraea sp. NPDC005650 TaxID=3157045 RepID=UPI0033A1A34C